MLESTKPVNHIDHIEDLLFEGYDSVIDLQMIIDDLQNIFENRQNPAVNLSLKWDGNPSLFFGPNAQNQFFVATKSLLKKDPVSFTTNDQIESYYFDKPGLVEVLKTCLEYLPEVYKNSGLRTQIVQADVLYTQNTKFREASGIFFKPNTITYFVENDSPIRDIISRSKLGICHHTLYTNDLQRINNYFWLNSTPDVFCQSSGIFIPETMMYDKEIRAYYESIDLEWMDSKFPHFLNHFLVNSKIRNLTKTYVNSIIRTETNNSLPNIATLREYVDGKYSEKIDSLTKQESKQNKLTEKMAIDSFIIQNEMHFEKLFEYWVRIKEYKELLLKKLQAINTDITPYTNLQEGGAPVKHEGFVLNSHGQQIKLVDRYEFSRNNFNNEKYKN
jgi:Family of unknown function (DUF6267)